jgi:hypothetical protein
MAEAGDVRLGVSHISLDRSSDRVPRSSKARLKIRNNRCPISRLVEGNRNADYRPCDRQRLIVRPMI